MYDRENDKLTEVTIDVYAEWILIQIFANISDKKLRQVIDSLLEFSEPKGIYVKDRTKDSSCKNMEGLIHGEHHPKEFIVGEGNYKFYVNLTDYLDTGLFLDNRNVRHLVQKYLHKGGRLLNLFSYTATSSIYASEIPDVQTVNVDVSNTFNEWAKKNFELNNIPLDNHRFYSREVMKFMNSEKGKPEKYDLIIVDPPTFAHSKEGDFSVQRDYVHLLNDCLFALDMKGRIIFTNHFKDFFMHKNKIRGKVVETTDKTIPSDFVKKNIHNSFLITASSVWERNLKK